MVLLFRVLRTKSTARRRNHWTYNACEHTFLPGLTAPTRVGTAVVDKIYAIKKERKTLPFPNKKNVALLFFAAMSRSQNRHRDV
jgi:hypothetical protein